MLGCEQEDPEAEKNAIASLERWKQMARNKYHGTVNANTHAGLIPSDGTLCKENL